MMEKKILNAGGRRIELYKGVRIFELGEEEFIDLSNFYCPFCGGMFREGETLIEVETMPVVKIYGEPAMDALLITAHLECTLKEVGAI